MYRKILDIHACRAARFTISMVGFLALAPACVGEPDGGFDGAEGASALPAPQDAAQGQLRDIEVIQYEGGSVTFHEVTHSDGSTRIGVSELFDNRLPVPVLDQLFAEDDDLTSAEAYLALNPGGEIPDVIAAHHESEAALLGRTSTDIREVEFQFNTAVDKVSPSTCDAWIYPNEGVNQGQYSYTLKRRTNYRSGTVDLAVGNHNNDFEYATTSTVTLGACNASSSSMTAQRWIRRHGQAWELHPPANIPAGSGWIWHNFQDVSYSNPGCPGCLPTPQPSSYAVRGQGSDFHLRTALSQRVVIIR